MQQRTMKLIGIALGAIGLVIAESSAQINTGSDGSDGVLNPTTYSTNIDMNNRPSGIYQYISVNVANSVIVTFTPNANNTPVIWLVQSNVTINGIVDVSGLSATASGAGPGGPGGYRGGNGSSPAGQGPGGGGAGVGLLSGGCASYGSLGETNITSIGLPGPIYGNNYLIPLLGGSGGGAAISNFSSAYGGGGGGAILIASSGSIQLNGQVRANSGWGGYSSGSPFVNGGLGSGGAVRFVASAIAGSGTVSTTGDFMGQGYGYGRVRFDTYLNNFGGQIAGVFSQGSQFVIIPASGSGAQLLVASVAGVPVSSMPSGVLVTPDVFVPALQTNPIPIVVQCSNVPLSSAITVTVTPMSGAPISAIGSNNSGTVTSSTATVLMNMPRGGGYISATVAAGN